MKPKFRAWDVHEKKMFTNDQLIIWNGNVYANDNPELNVNNLKGWSIDEKYLMQSTGLKYKNGTEIYEGDIVKFTIANGFDYVVDECGIVAYKFGALYVVNRLGEYLISDIYTNDVEVIGNKYENPELLKGCLGELKRTVINW